MKQPVRNLILCLIAVILSVCPLFGASAESEDLTEPFVIDLDLSAMSGTVVYAQVYRRTALSTMPASFRTQRRAAPRELNLSGRANTSGRMHILKSERTSWSPADLNYMRKTA